MQRRGRRAHHDRRLLERDGVRDRNRVRRRDGDALREAAVALLAEHVAVRHQVVQRHALIRPGDDAGDLVTEGDREADARSVGAIVRVAVADAGAADLDHDFAFAGDRIVDDLFDERRPFAQHSDRAHRLPIL